MIYLYSGTPGSGKSLHSARTIYYNLLKKLPVIANFDINEKYKKKLKGEFIFWGNDELTPEKLTEYSKNYFNNKKIKESQILLVIDECQMLFNAREWNAKGRKEWLYFFTHHRKFGYDIILVAQFDNMIDRQIRSLIEYQTIHRKVSNFGIKGKIISLFALGNLFVSVKVWYPMKEKIGSEFFRAKKRYCNLYDTFNNFDS